MRRPIAIAILLVVALAGGIVFGTYRGHRASLLSVSIRVPDGIHASIYNDLGGDGPYSYNPKGAPLFSITNSQNISLKAGVYDVVITNQAELYDNPVTRVTVQYGTKEIDVQPNYTTQKLASLLPAEQIKAIAALYKSYPLIHTNYTVTNQHLYGLGDWYGAVLEPTNPINDKLRFIMHKSGDTWKLITDPPQLSVGQPSYPTIPINIISSVDSL